MPVLTHVRAESPALAILRTALNGPLQHHAAADAGLPPEVHAFAVGSDATLFGVVVPAPEVTSPTWYSAMVPEQGEAALYRTIHAGAVAWAQPMARIHDDVAAVANALYAVPDRRVAVPVDYLELSGADGLPIWVPRWSWRESDVGALVSPLDVPERITELVSAGRPGSALQLGRYMTHQLRRYPDQHALSDAIWRALADAYRALNRPRYGTQADTLGGVEPGLTHQTTAAGDVPVTHLASVAPRLHADLVGFAGVLGGHVTIEPARRTQGVEEVVLHLTVSLDPTRRQDGADMAHVLLVQAIANETTHGPVVGEVVECCLRIPQDTPRPADSDAAGLRIFERGYLIVAGNRPLGPREGDLSPFMSFR